MSRRSGQVFDVIVIGAGSSGCVVAARLSEDPSTRVLLLEAGPTDRNPWIHIPLGYGKTLANPRLNWMYESGPEPGLEGRRLRWPRGRGLGGSSSVNGLLHVRGSAADYDRWAAGGNVGWAYRDLLPFFRRTESHVLDGDFHGGEGPVSVEGISWRNALSDAYLAASVEAGIPRNDDFNGAVQEGVGYYHQTSRRGRRTSATAYLRAARRRSNLEVTSGVLVTRILVEDGRAVGIACSRNGAEFVVRAVREIVLCAGAVASPQILQLSGIGPAEVLARAGITPILDRKDVGRNLQDHYAVNSTYRAKGAATLNEIMASWSGRVQIGLAYGFRRTGPLAMPAGTVGAFTRSSPDLPEPDIQISYAPFTADAYGAKLHSYPAFRSSVYVMRPRSRGEVTITSPRPDAKPSIIGGYLTEEEDRRKTVAALRVVRRIADATALAAFRGDEVRPGTDVRSDEDLLAYAIRNGGSSYHPVGTCRMGQDPDAVVDETLKVRGLRGLRIADASIMPLLVSGNTNAASLMIGEKCADLLRRDTKTI